MKLEDILIFKQNLKDQEYEDKLSTYFSLHYEILRFYTEGDNYHIGEIYFDKKKEMYIVITHQIHDSLFFVNLQYDSNGKLLESLVSGKIYDLDKNYEKVGTYDEFMKNEKKRIRIGLELERKAHKYRLELIEKELEKI